MHPPVPLADDAAGVASGSALGVLKWPSRHVASPACARFLGLSPHARAPSLRALALARSAASQMVCPKCASGQCACATGAKCEVRRRTMRLCCALLALATRAPRAVCALRTSLCAVAVAVAVARALSMHEFGSDATSSFASLRLASPRLLASPRCDSAARAATAPAATPHARCAPCVRRWRLPRVHTAKLRCTAPRQDCGGSATGKSAGACSCTPGACKCSGGCLCAKCKTAAQ